MIIFGHCFCFAKGLFESGCFLEGASRGRRILVQLCVFFYFDQDLLEAGGLLEEAPGRRSLLVHGSEPFPLLGDILPGLLGMFRIL